MDQSSRCYAGIRGDLVSGDFDSMLDVECSIFDVRFIYSVHLSFSPS